MENKINIAELLRNCPKGMELDCVLNDNVTFECILDRNCYPIQIQTPEGNMRLSQYGCLSLSRHAKCVIFPKGKTTWKGFVPPYQFKDGDVLTYMVCNKPTIYIYRENGRCNTSYYVGYSSNNEHLYEDGMGALSGNRTDLRLATEEEKEKLFQAIQDKGYKWNSKTKTLEKLVEPRFKVGDRVKHISACTSGIVVKVGDKGYYIDFEGVGVRYISFTLEKDYILAPNKFDITTLVPFESRVLVRNDINQLWIPAFWGYKRDNGYATTFGWCQYCIPYEGNEHLLNTANDCDDFYKTWE